MLFRSLGKSLRIQLDTNHSQDRCPRRKPAIRYVSATLDAAQADQEELEEHYEEDYDDTGGKPNSMSSLDLSIPHDLQQTLDQRLNDPHFLPDEARRLCSSILSRNKSTNVNPQPEHMSCSSSDIATNKSSTVCPPRVNCVVSDGLRAKIVRSVKAIARRIMKAKSPAARARLGKMLLVAILDPGAEVTCLNEDLAIKANVKVVNTDSAARAAGTTMLEVVGQTEDPLLVTIFDEYGQESELDLGHVPVVRNLGSDLLVGQPGNQHNKIGRAHV